MEVLRYERGFAGHFAGAKDCTFRRNTLLQFRDQNIVVSTVGNCRPTKLKDGILVVGDIEPVIGEAYYETRVHVAMFYGGYYESDIQRGIIEFNSNHLLTNRGQEGDLEADKMHEVVVKEIAEKLALRTLELPPEPNAEEQENVESN